MYVQTVGIDCPQNHIYIHILVIIGAILGQTQYWISERKKNIALLVKVYASENHKADLRIAGHDARNRKKHSTSSMKTQVHVSAENDASY